MKRILTIAAVICLLFCGCGISRTNETTSDNISSLPADESRTENSSTLFSQPEASTSMPEITTETATEEETSQNAAASANSTDRCFYGDKTNTEKTYTGLTPLSHNSFANIRLDNSKGLSQKTIEHSFGVASNGIAHTISVQCQSFFDENSFDAVCYDNKTNEKRLYLTFDCGYENGYTAKILDTLRDKNVKAAFFCTLPQVKGNCELIARMINEGHIVGNHSVTHPDFSTLTRKEMYNELKEFDDYLRDNFGYSSLYFRYPQGKYSENSLDLINSMGYKCVFWSLAYNDWDLENQKGVQYALDTVSARFHSGAVILLHSVSPDNANALGSIIDNAKSLGYEFYSLEDM